jgi:hypothetical protein
MIKKELKLLRANDICFISHTAHTKNTFAKLFIFTYKKDEIKWRLIH